MIHNGMEMHKLTTINVHFSGEMCSFDEYVVKLVGGNTCPGWGGGDYVFQTTYFNPKLRTTH